MYRKMYLEGFILLIINSLCTVLFDINKILCTFATIIVALLCGFFVNKYYVNKSVKKVNKIMNSKIKNDNIKLVAECAKKGGTNFSAAIIFSFAISILIIFLSSLFLALKFGVNLGSLFNKIIENKNGSSEVNYGTNSSDELNYSVFRTTYVYDSNYKIDDILDYSVPQSFETNDSLSGDSGNPVSYNISTSSNSSVFKNCNLQISLINNYSNSSEYIKDIKEKYDNLDTSIKKINNNSWYYFELKNVGASSSISYYLMDYNNDVLIIDYDIEGNADIKECREYLSEIEKSLKLK